MVLISNKSSLPEADSVSESDSVGIFKRKLDRFWSNQESKVFISLQVVEIY